MQMRFGLFGGARSSGDGPAGDSIGYRNYIDYVLHAEALGFHSDTGAVEQAVARAGTAARDAANAREGRLFAMRESIESVTGGLGVAFEPGEAGELGELGEVVIPDLGCLSHGRHGGLGQLRLEDLELLQAVPQGVEVALQLDDDLLDGPMPTAVLKGL